MVERDRASGKVARRALGYHRVPVEERDGAVGRLCEGAHGAAVEVRRTT